jgi:hypothetical protein
LRKDSEDEGGATTHTQAKLLGQTRGQADGSSPAPPRRRPVMALPACGGTVVLGCAPRARGSRRSSTGPLAWRIPLPPSTATDLQRWCHHGRSTRARTHAAAAGCRRAGAGERGKVRACVRAALTALGRCRGAATSSGAAGRSRAVRAFHLALQPGRHGRTPVAAMHTILVSAGCTHALIPRHPRADAAALRCGAWRKTAGGRRRGRVCRGRPNASGGRAGAGWDRRSRGYSCDPRGRRLAHSQKVNPA